MRSSIPDAGKCGMILTLPNACLGAGRAAGAGGGDAAAAAAAPGACIEH